MNWFSKWWKSLWKEEEEKPFISFAPPVCGENTVIYNDFSGHIIEPEPEPVPEPDYDLPVPHFSAADIDKLVDINYMDNLKKTVELDMTGAKTSDEEVYDEVAKLLTEIETVVPAPAPVVSKSSPEFLGFIAEEKKKKKAKKTVAKKAPVKKVVPKKETAKPKKAVKKAVAKKKK
jgi:hypothetical protein